MYGGQSNANGSGIQICVEPLNEWKIQEIGYDGVEKYIKPPTFKDILRKNAQSIDWSKIIGEEAIIGTCTEESDSDDSQLGGTSSGLAQSSKGFVEPVAGPWALVAKHLHYSLQEVNVLLDCLRIARTDYLDLLVTALVQDERTEAEQTTVSKAFQLHIRRRVLNETSKDIERMATTRRGASIESDKSNFFNELRELRETWRIRKVGPNIFGDLGYKTFAPKFAPHEVFDVTQKSAANRRQGAIRFSNRSFIELRLPQNLRYRTNLVVFIEPDDEKSAESFFKVTSRLSSVEQDAAVKHVHWKKALPWAQNSLICKDILARLVSESVTQHDLITLTAENSIVISLFDSLLLKVEAQCHPFGDSRTHSDGVPYLSQSLRQLFLAEHTKKPKRAQQFVTLPLVSHSEGLDMRGPIALSAEEINARFVGSSSSSSDLHSSDLLIRKFIQCTSHYVLISRTVDFLQNHMINFSDPQIQWKWIRATQIFSIISLHFSSRGFENLGKFTTLIRISDSSITLISKESQQIECRRDMEMFESALLLLAAHFLLNSSQVLSRAYGWQLLHANSNAFDSAGNFAPTFYACNQNGTMSIFVQFHTDGASPSIFIKNNKKYSQPQFVSQNLDGFRSLNYQRIPGTTFMRKIDNLLAIFTN